MRTHLVSVGVPTCSLFTSHIQNWTLLNIWATVLSQKFLSLIEIFFMNRDQQVMETPSDCSLLYSHLILNSLWFDPQLAQTWRNLLHSASWSRSQSQLVINDRLYPVHSSVVKVNAQMHPWSIPDQSTCRLTHSLVRFPCETWCDS